MHRIRHWLWLGTLTLVLAGLAPAVPGARAAGVWYVAPAGDNANNCSTPATPCATLNGVIAKAAAGDTIRAMGGTYRDTGAEAALINKSVTLAGGWDNDFAAQTFMSYIDGQMQRRSVTIPAGVTVTIERFTIHGGVHSNGPGVYNAGTLTLIDSEINANWNSGGDYGKAGGLYNLGTAVLQRTSVFNNKSNSSGGGIVNEGQLTLTASAIVGNSACCYIGAMGGGLMTISPLTVTINNTTIAGNNATFMGGGLAVGAQNNQPAGPVYLSNTTIVSNLAQYGGGVWASHFALVLRNTLVANNHGGQAPDCSVYITSAGYNLIGNTAGCNFTPGAGDLVNVAAGLGARAGLPAYLPLLTGSPALEAGDPAGCRDQAGTPLTADIRGVARPQGAACDIGAYEAELTDLRLSVADLVGPVTVGQARTHTVVIANAGPTAAEGVVYTATLSAPVEMALTPSQGVCPLSGPAAQCELGRLEAGAQATVTVMMTVTQSRQTDLTYTGVVLAPTVADAQEANNTVQLSAPIWPAELDLSISVAPEPAIFGAPVTYTLWVTNTGPSPAAGVSLTDTLPLSATLLAAEAGAGTCAAQAGTLTCALGDLAAGASLPVTITLMPGQRGAAELINVTRAVSNMPQTAAAVLTTTTAIAPADLGLALDQPAGTLKVGAPVTYTLTVSNAGPAAATGVQLDFPWPAALALTRAEFGPGSCALDAGTLRCTLERLAASASLSATLIATPLSGGDQPITATVTANEPDPHPVGNVVSGVTPVELFGVFLPSVNYYACRDFADSFDNPASGWPALDDELRWQGYANGEYRLMSRQAGYLLFATAPACPHLRGVVGVDARWEGEPGAFYGLRFGIAPDFSTYFLFLVNTDYQLFTLVQRTPSGFAEIVPLTPSTAIRAGNAVNRLEVVLASNGAVMLRINGQDNRGWYFINLNPLTRAGLAINPYDDVPVADARFDNFFYREATPVEAMAQAGVGRPGTPATLPARLRGWEPQAAPEP